MVKRRPFAIWLFSLFLTLPLASSGAAAAKQFPKKVLLLTSHHQGDRWNDSVVQGVRVGEGSEFRILLPVLEGHTIEDKESTALTPHGKEHILFIDDEEILVELGQAMLTRLGYCVTTRSNSLDALTTFQNQPDAFDLIITDQTMAGMTGVDLARRILQLRPEMPIILCTGYSSQISEDKAKAAGIRGFAYKPLAKKEIGELIREVLDGKKS